MIRRVRGVSAAATRVEVELEAVFEAPLEPDQVGAEQRRHGQQRVVRRPLHQHVVAGRSSAAQTRKFAPEVPVAVATWSVADAVARRDALHERLPPFVVPPRQLDRLAGPGQIGQRAGGDIAPAQVVGGMRPALGPEQVVGAGDLDGPDAGDGRVRVGEEGAHGTECIGARDSGARR